MHSRTLLIIGIFSIVVISLFAETFSLDDVMPEISGADWLSVMNEERISRRADGADDLNLLPRGEAFDSVRRNISNADPNVVSESLLLVKKGAADQDARYFYNSFRRVGDLAVIEYYNPEHEKSHTLFKWSRHVARPGSDRELSDPIIPDDSPLPAEDSIYVWQFLKPINDMYFRYTYTMSDSVLRISVDNVTSLKYGIFPVIGKGNFVTELILIFGEEYLLFYGVGGVKVFNPLNIIGEKVEPFYYRIDGVFDWYNTNFLQPWLVAGSE